MKVLVTGGHGTLGRALQAIGFSAIYASRDRLDVTDGLRTHRALNDANPDVVVHAAALTDHQHPDAGAIIQTNIEGTRHVARWCRAQARPLVYLSTHYVYPGDRGMYAEHDACKPIGAYAWSKLAGENLVLDAVWDALVIRGSWYDYPTRLQHWLTKGALTDAWCAREHVSDAARKIAVLVRAGIRGVVNIGGARRTFAEICEAEGFADFPTTTRVRLATPYAFPRDTSVDTAKFDALKLAWREEGAPYGANRPEQEKPA
jgi:dTDP-4-dehydrorhamnose reductase